MRVRFDSAKQKLSLRIAVGCLCFALCSEGALAASYSLNYSGRLTRSDGSPLEGTVPIQAKFWNAASDGIQLGQAFEVPAVNLSAGVFTLELAFTADQVAAIFGDGSAPVYIEISSDNKIYPRQQYSYVPFALRVPVDPKTLSFDADGKLSLSLTTKPATNQFLTKDSDGKLTWGTPAAATIQNQAIATGTPSSGQVLTYNGSQWTALTPVVGGGSGSGSAVNLASAVTGTLAALNGGTGVNSAATFPLSGVVVTRDATETLNNKTITAATINGSSTIGGSTVISTTGTVASGAATVNGNVTLRGNGTSANKLILNDKGSTNFLSLKAPDALAASVTWELPATDGSSGQVLATNGSGALSWTSSLAPIGNAGGDLTGSFPNPTLVNVGIAGAYSKVIVDSKGRVTSGGSLASGDIPNLSASQITNGTLNSAQLPTAGTVGTYAKVTTDAYGRVTAGSTLSSADIPPISATLITSGTLNTAQLPTAGTAGAYAKVTTDAYGRVTAGTTLASSDVTSSLGFTPLNKTGDTMSGTLILPTNGLTVGTNQFVLANANVGIGTTAPAGKLDVAGSICLSGANCISSWPTGSVTSVTAGTGLTGGPITSAGSISLANTAVTPGGYSRANITVDAQGRLTAAANGGNVSLTTEVGGVLPIANGGTGSANAANAFNALSPLTTLGDLLYGGASGAGTRLAGNTTTSKQFLTSVGSGSDATAPVWGLLAASDIPAHSAALITSGTLSVANGGTGASILAANHVLLGNGTSAPLTVAPGASGNVLTSDGTTWTSSAVSAPNWTTSGANVYRSSGNVGIGTTSPANTLAVAGTANFTGNVGVGSTAPNSPLTVIGNSSGTSGIYNGFSLAATADPPSSSAAFVMAASFSSTSLGAYNTARIYGLWSKSSHLGSGVVAAAYGAQLTASNDSSGTVTDAVSLRTTTKNSGTGTITNGYGVRVDAPTNDGGGSFSNYYGLHITAPTVATTNYSIYSTGGTNYFGGNVGIGTSSPAGKLDVAGSICLNGANCITSWPSAGGYWATSGGNSYVASGNLGVGTASPAADLSFGGTLARTIQVDRNTGAGTSGGGLTLQAGGAISGGSNYNGGTLTLASGVATGTGTSAIEFKTASAGTSGAVDSSPTTKMTILGNGNVGIGTTSPTSQLMIGGTTATAISSTLTTVSANTLGTSAGSSVTLASFGAMATGPNWVNLGLKLNRVSAGIGWTNTAVGLTMDVDNTPNAGGTGLWLTGGGNVGIGTINPQDKLTIAGATNNLFFRTNSDSVITNGMGLRTSSTGFNLNIDSYSNIAFHTDTDLNEGGGAATEKLRITTTGNVGIGTTAPLAMLDVIKSGTNDPLLRVGGPNATDNPAIMVQNGGGSIGLSMFAAGSTAAFLSNSAVGDVGLRRSGTGNMLFGTGGNAAALAITSSGNVGIGTTTPASALDVNGSAKVANDASACSALNAGSIRFNGHDLQVCAGTTWQTINTASSTPTVLSYTGADQTYTVPAGVTTITVKLWGGGGGGGSVGGWTHGFDGGAGGFSMGKMTVTPGQQLTVIVGGGGFAGSGANAALVPANYNVTTYGGGGAGCTLANDCRYSGNGGGRSEIKNGSTRLIVAGGGGGGGVLTNGTNGQQSQAGGAGGGYSGQNGWSESYNGYVYCKGMAGNQSGGGQGGFSTAYSAAAPSGTAGAGANNYGYGAGGGGGWYGGGAGAYCSVAPATMGGGGGGSGYVGGTGVSSAITITGNGPTPPNMTDLNYVSGIALGGQGGASPTAGGSGMVVIYPY